MDVHRLIVQPLAINHEENDTVRDFQAPCRADACANWSSLTAHRVLGLSRQARSQSTETVPSKPIVPMLHSDSE